MPFITILRIILYIGIALHPGTALALELLSGDSPIDTLTSPAAESRMSADTDEPAPDLEWGCIVESQYGTGVEVEVERCGYGTYEESCMWAEGVEECLTFFEIHEEESGPSNVLFLPGIKGSRLYAGNGEKLWEPFGNHDIEALMLDSDGKSLRDDIRTEPGDIIDSIAGFADIYGSFMGFMDRLVADEVINEWIAVPYDWRLSLPDIVSAGEIPDRPIPMRMRSPTSLPIQTILENMAGSSKSGKVTIVAHSNGGLVAKQLMQEMGDSETARLIDDVIFVGVPQSGAPQSLGALLHGHDEGLPKRFPGIVSASVARAFAENAPMAYHLLPSDAYFDAIGDAMHAVATFGPGASYDAERAAYGTHLDSAEELRAFALAEDGGRTKPLPIRLDQPNVLNPALLDYADEVHDTLREWTPPNGVMLHQIGGWGEDTIAGIEYYEVCLLSFCIPKYRPSIVEDGDGVVPIPSALMMTEAENVKRYWLDLQYEPLGPATNRNHGNMLGAEGVQVFIKNSLLQNDASLPEDIHTGKIAGGAREKMLHYYLHSPLTLELHDKSGNRLGPNEDGSFDEEISGAHYGQFGEVQYAVLPAGAEYLMELDGYDTGTFTLEIEEVEDYAVLARVTFAEIPTTPDTHVTLSLENGLDDASALKVDVDGDGSADLSLPTIIGSIVTADDALEDDDGKNEISSKTQGQKRVLSENQEYDIDELRLRLYALLLQLLLEYMEILSEPSKPE